MLKQRILTACILIPLTLIILFLAPLPLFGLVTALLCLVAASEWAVLSQWFSLSLRLRYLGIMVAAGAVMLFIPPAIIMLLAFLWWILALVLILRHPRDEARLKAATGLRLAMGLMVILPCWAAINQLRAENGGVYGVLFIFLLVFGADTVAYFVGKKWGKHKLLEAVSPGKTWEGAVAAMVYSSLLALVTLFLGDTPHAVWPFAVVLCWVATAASIVGDLFESLMKRLAGVKDSGSWLPGHGGILDRIDGLTAAAPVFVFGAFLLGLWL